MSFDSIKSNILKSLADGVDFSPKGSIDKPCLALVNFINDHLVDYVTTSSCSGRVSVFRDEGAGKGVAWLLVEHGIVTVNEIKAAVERNTEALVNLKCEGFILHVRCRDIESGRQMHHIARSCGYRESGLTISNKGVMLAIRTTAFALETPIAKQRTLLVDEQLLTVLVKEVNYRIRRNFERISKFLYNNMKASVHVPSDKITKEARKDTDKEKYSAIPVNFACIQWLRKIDSHNQMHARVTQSPPEEKAMSLFSRSQTPYIPLFIATSSKKHSSQTGPISKEISTSIKRDKQLADFLCSIATDKANKDCFPDPVSACSTKSGAVPRKWEMVGDILMLPEGAFTSFGWEKLLPPPPSPIYDTSDIHRVARRAKVDSGPRRESHILLLLPAVGRENNLTDILPRSPGWCTVVENGIKFSFDITRIMFCSGNVTERMRMGRQVCDGQVVVDLYSGIGYYTIPFLVHGNAAHVHALEWNPFSVASLRHNLAQARIPSDRYSIYEESKSVLTPMHLSLQNIAHRVCCGLLPSSGEGWELAVSVLNKESGGIIHVHENVAEADVFRWAQEDLIHAFTMLFSREGIMPEGTKMCIACNHIEIVKNYAPRVVHAVVDLQCSVQQTSLVPEATHVDTEEKDSSIATDDRIIVEQADARDDGSYDEEGSDISEDKEWWGEDEDGGHSWEQFMPVE
eukprot:GSChrysophyteH1.ASY1.ANO1.1621.1 assembled CDS